MAWPGAPGGELRRRLLGRAPSLEQEPGRPVLPTSTFADLEQVSQVSPLMKLEQLSPPGRPSVGVCGTR